MDYDQVLEAQKRLEEKFPKMFSGKYGGLEIGPGWVSLVELLCTYIQGHADWEQKRNPDFQQVTVEQIKEKFGTLRFYYSGGDEYVSGLVSLAEGMSAHICEVCGNNGKLIKGSWLKTRCKEHE